MQRRLEITVRHFVVVKRQECRSNRSTRQQDKFKILLDNYGTALDYATTATNSAGTALDKYENSYIKSAAAAQARFTAQFEQMSTAILNSDLLIGTIDTGAGMLGALTQLANLVGGLPLLASAAAGAVSAILNKGFFSTYTKQNENGSSGIGLTNIISSGRNNAAAMEAQIANDVKMMSIYESEVKQCGTSTQLFNNTMGKCSEAARAQAGALRDGTMTAQVWGEQQRRNNQALLQTSIATKAAAFGMKAFSIAMNMALTMGIGIAINLLVKEISYLANAEQKAAEKTRELQQEYENLKSTVTSIKDELKSTSARIDELREKGSLTFVEQSELTKLLETNSELERQLHIKEKLEEYARAETHKSTVDLYSKQGKNLPVTDADGNAESFEDMDIFEVVQYSMESIDKFQTKVRLLKKELADIEPETEEYLEKSSKIDYFESNIEGINRLLLEQIDFISQNKDFLKTSSDEYKSSVSALTNYDVWSNTDFTSKFDEIYDSKKFESVRKEIEKLAQTSPITEDTLSKFPAFIGALEKAGLSASATAEHINALAKSEFLPSIPGTIDDVISGITKAENAFGTLGKILSESLDEDTNVSLDSLTKLKEEFGGLGDSYQAAIEVISNSKSSYAEIKNAVNSLANAYLASSDVVKIVNDGNAEAVILGLKNLGIVNAEEVAQQALRNAKIETAIATEIENNNTGHLTDSTIDLISATYGLASGTEEAAKMLTLWNLKKQLASNGSLEAYLKNDRDGFIALATAAGIAARAVSRYGEVTARVESLKNIVASSGSTGGAKTALAAAEAELKNLGAEIESEINSSLDQTYNFNIDLKPASSSKNKKEIEEYKAVIDELYKAEEKLARIQNERSSIQLKFNLTDDLDAQLQYLEQMNRLYKDEQAQLHIINDLRDGMIQRNVDTLRGQNFEVEYDPVSNKLLINNMEHVNDLKGKDLEATNALIKEYEDLIKTTIEWNNENIDGSNQYLEIVKNIKDTLEQAQTIKHQKYTNDIGKNENNLSLLGNQYDKSIQKTDDSRAVNNLKQQSLELLAIQEKSATEAARLRAEGLTEDNELIQACVSKYWEAEKQIEDINSNISDSLLAPYDEFISRADDFNWWSDIDTTKVEWLEKKLKKINQLFADGRMSEDRHRELVEETAKSIYDIKNQAIQDTIDLTMELIKQEKQNRIDHLEEEKKAYADIVHAKKEALALTKEEYGYQKTLTDKLAKIAKIQNKLNELAPDDSREATVQKKQLAEELAKLQGDLDDTQAEHTYQSQVDALDKSQEAFEKSKDDEIKVIEESINSTQKLYDLAIKRIDAGWDELYRDLTWYNTNYGDGINGQDSIKSAWEEAKAAAVQYGDVVSALSGIKTENVPNSGGNGSVKDNPKNSAEVQNIVLQMRARKDQWHAQITQAGKDKLASENEEDAQKLNSLGINVVKGHDGVWYIDRVGGEKLFEKYHDGGTVGRSKIKSDERITTLQDNEVVVPKDKVSPLYKKLDFASFVIDTLGGSLSGNFDKSFFKFLPQDMLSSLTKTQVPSATSFSPTIEVNINGPISNDSDPQKFGKAVGNSALDVLKTAILKGGAV